MFIFFRILSEFFNSINEIIQKEITNKMNYLFNEMQNLKLFPINDDLNNNFQKENIKKLEELEQKIKNKSKKIKTMSQNFLEEINFQQTEIDELTIQLNDIKNDFYRKMEDEIYNRKEYQLELFKKTIQNTFEVMIYSIN